MGRPTGSVRSSTRPLISVMIALVSDPRPWEASHRGDSGIARRAISAYTHRRRAGQQAHPPPRERDPTQCESVGPEAVAERVPMRPVTIPPTDQKFIVVVAVAASATGHEFRDRRGHRRLLRAYTHRGEEPE
ncbi:MAG TPA: hypothetical protein VF003_11910 [Pseudonocardiaceae bacterium]